jgi:hypothetical protein
MKVYTAVFARRTQDNQLETFGIDMHLTKTDALKEAKIQAKQNEWRFMELRSNP